MIPENATFFGKIISNLNNVTPRISSGIKFLQRFISKWYRNFLSSIVSTNRKKYKIMVVTSQKHHVLQSIFRCWRIFSPYSISYQLNPYVNIYTLQLTISSMVDITRLENDFMIPKSIYQTHTKNYNVIILYCKRCLIMMWVIVFMIYIFQTYFCNNLSYLLEYKQYSIL